MAVPALNGSVSSTSGFPQPQISNSVSHTVAAGLTDSILIILASNPTQQATSAGWNGVLMPGKAQWNTGGFCHSVFWMKNPPAGAFTAGVTWSAFQSGTSMAVLTFTGVSDVHFGDTTASDTNTSVTVTFPTVGKDSLAVQICTSTTAFGGTVHSSDGTQTSDINAGQVVGQPVPYRVSTAYKTASAPGVDTSMTTTFVNSYFATISSFLLLSADYPLVVPEPILM